MGRAMELGMSVTCLMSSVVGVCRKAMHDSVIRCSVLISGGAECNHGTMPWEVWFYDIGI